MHTARKTPERCPNCRTIDNVWTFGKPEESGFRACYVCKNCGHEWSEITDEPDV